MGKSRYCASVGCSYRTPSPESDSISHPVVSTSALVVWGNADDRGGTERGVARKALIRLMPEPVSRYEKLRGFIQCTDCRYEQAPWFERNRCPAGHPLW